MTVLNVQDYGARGDGSTDDTSAIQAAIDDADDGDTVYIPATSDYYLVSTDTRAAVEVDANHADDLTIRGDGYDSYILLDRIPDGRHAWPIGASTEAGEIHGLVFEHLRISGNRAENPSSRTNAGGIHTFPSAPRADVTYRHLLVEDCGSSAIRTATSGVTFEWCTAHRNEGHGFEPIDTTFPDGEWAILIKNCKAINNGAGGAGFGNGFNVEGNVRVENCYSENNQDGNKTSGVDWADSGFTEQWWVNFNAVNEGAPGAYYNTMASEDDGIIHLDNFQVLDSQIGYRFTREGDVHFDCREILTDGATQYGIRAKERPIIDIETAHIYNSGDGIVTSTDRDFTITQLCHSGNDDLISDFTGTLTIDDSTQQSPTRLNVPGPDDVGAWSSEANDRDGGDDQEETFESWTPRWASTTDDWTIVSGSDFDGGHALRFEHDGSSRSRYAISWDAVGEPSDVEVVDKFRVPSLTDDENLGIRARIHLRSSTVDGSEQGYWVGVRAPDDAFRLAKYVDGSPSLVDLAQFGTPRENTFFYRRFRAEGEQLKVKIWPADESEPAEWDVEVVDAEFSDGWVGLGSFDTGAVETDVFSVATGGESASLRKSESPPTVSWIAPSDGDIVRETVAFQIDATDDEDADDSLTVEYRLDDGAWRAADYNPDTGYFEAVWDSAGVEDGEYNLQARASNSSNESSEAAIDLKVQNNDGADSLSVDQFDVTDNSNPVWSRFDVDWAVSDEEGNLDTVVTKLRYEGTTVAAESTSVSGETADFTHVVRVRGAVDEIRLSVNDTSNESLTVSEDV